MKTLEAMMKHTVWDEAIKKWKDFNDEPSYLFQLFDEAAREKKMIRWLIEGK